MVIIVIGKIKVYKKMIYARGWKSLLHLLWIQTAMTAMTTVTNVDNQWLKEILTMTNHHDHP